MKTQNINLVGIIVIINIIVVLLVVGNADSVLPKRECLWS
jgi:hypothetical protein